MDVLSRHSRRWRRLAILLAALLVASELLADQPFPFWRPPQFSPPLRDPEHAINRTMVSYKDLKTRNIVMQQRDYSCGAAALATVLRFYWGDKVEEIDVLKQIEAILSVDDLRDRVENGLSIADLRRTAVKLGYQSAIGTMEVEKLKEAKVPVIVALQQEDYNHFVVVRGFCGSYIYLADPIRGNVRMTVDEFSKQWIKKTLLVAVKPGKTESTVSRIGIYPGEVDRQCLNHQVLRTLPQVVVGGR
jgi:predicted double-glycine peptidase